MNSPEGAPGRDRRWRKRSTCDRGRARCGSVEGRSCGASTVIVSTHMSPQWRQASDASVALRPYRRCNGAPDSGMNSEQFWNDFRCDRLLRSRRIVTSTREGTAHGHALRRLCSPRRAIRAAAADAQSNLHRRGGAVARARHRRERRDLSPHRHRRAAQPRRSRVRRSWPRSGPMGRRRSAVTTASTRKRPDRCGK